MVMIRMKFQGKLKDGQKIVVFNGTFVSTDPPSSPHSSHNIGDLVDLKLSLDLQVNCVRIAHSDALLGFCRPQFLMHGLSLPSLTLGRT
jgi:hypothetical protein